VGSLFGLLIGTLILAICARRARKSSALISGDGFQLEYSRAMRIVSIFALLFAFGVTIMAVFAQKPSAYILAVVLNFCGFYLVLESFLVRIFFDEKKICKWSVWKRPQTIFWNDLTDGGFSEVNKWYVLRTKNETMRVSIYLAGIETFEEACLRLMPPECE
jgi:hypothetical protein